MMHLGRTCTRFSEAVSIKRVTDIVKIIQNTDANVMNHHLMKNCWEIEDLEFTILCSLPVFIGWVMKELNKDLLIVSFKIFLKQKKLLPNIQQNLKNEHCDSCFPTNVTLHMNELNLKLQENVCDLTGIEDLCWNGNFSNYKLM